MNRRERTAQFKTARKQGLLIATDPWGWESRTHSALRSRKGYRAPAGHESHSQIDELLHE